MRVLRGAVLRTVVACAATSSVAVVALATADPAHAYRPRPQVVFQSEKPETYVSGCHVPAPVKVPKTCVSGDPRGAISVLLVGDSHAAQLQPALAAYGARHGMRITNLTKSSCPAADVPVGVWPTSRAYRECRAWQSHVLSGLQSGAYGRFDVAVVSQYSGHVLLDPRGRRLAGAARKAAWQSGTKRLLGAVDASAEAIVVVRDSPELKATTFTCLIAAWPKAGCATPASQALRPGMWRAEVAAAGAVRGTTTLDLSTPYCAARRCRPVSGAYLAFRDRSHWTRTYSARVLSNDLGPAVLARAPKPPKIAGVSK